MSKVVIHRTALLLIAVLAMLPLQSIQAALGSPAAQSMHTTDLHEHSSAHGMSAMSDMQGCPMHQAGKGKMPGGKHCSGSCKLCGACAAALLPTLQLRSIALREQHASTFESVYHPPSGTAPFRPPRH